MRPTTHTQQHIYGVALYTSSSPECRHKTTLTFAQGDLLRLERKDNDTWNARVQGAAPVSGCPFAAMGGSKGEVHTSLIQVVCTMYRLHKTCEEYQKVAKLFEPSCTNGTTSCSTFHVDRVQNTALWQDFYLLRERLFRRLGAEGLNEKLLWHGCSGPVVLPRTRSCARSTYTRERDPLATESANMASSGAECMPMKTPHNAAEPHR